MLRFKIFYDFLPDVDLFNARAGKGHRLGKHNGGAIRAAVFLYRYMRGSGSKR